MKTSILTFFAILSATISLAQTTIRGRVVDARSGNGLIGASVYLEDFNEGSFTDFDGFFQFKTRVQGQTNLVATTMGYSKVKKYIFLSGTGLMNMGDIVLEPSAIGLQEADVIASVSVDRATPVAVSTIDAREIEEKIGDRELVEVLNFTPGVYATKGGGGFGDSRINIRGFDQRNVAVLVNGIPVNDMENGWVYWSNWAGLGDAVRTMQVQRGLGASKLAINSVGGTINIVTKATDVEKGGSFKTSITDYGLTKHMLSLSSGVLPSGWAVSAIGSRTYGEGYVDATFVDAWSYFLTAAKDFGGHRLVFTAIGAPQTHGQRRGQLTVNRFNDINKLPDSLGYEGHRWNDDWGYLDGEVLNSKVNGYHKPQIALNHYFQLTERAPLSTSASVSFGKGYGSRYDGTNNARLYETLADGTTVQTTRYWDYLYESNVNNT
ncbi:MAG: TonB-dependent receptor plug domain-containing protein, partial [Flavobacteriales bacterium]|nr:TonB-dependent receptor plug domain-containing protein [Flavobacteriales bacterium]